MLQFNTLEDVGAAYVEAAQGETNALFIQGEIVLAAIDKGFAVKDVVRHCASLTRRQARTVFTRYAVARTFPPDKRDMELDWYMHSLCAGTSDPYKWLQIAADGYTDEYGNHKGHTSRTLKAAIKAAGGNPDNGKPVVILDAVTGRLQSVGINFVDFVLSSEICDQIKQYEGAVIQITLVQAIAPEKGIAA